MFFRQNKLIWSVHIKYGRSLQLWQSGRTHVSFVVYRGHELPGSRHILNHRLDVAKKQFTARLITLRTEPAEWIVG
jgi:hypothetical protein